MTSDGATEVSATHDQLSHRSADALDRFRNKASNTAASGVLNQVLHVPSIFGGRIRVAGLVGTAESVGIQGMANSCGCMGDIRERMASKVQRGYRLDVPTSMAGQRVDAGRA